MHFDINELKSRLILLEELLNSTDDKYKKIEIFNDINKIKYLIRYIDKNALLNLYDTNEGIIGDYKEKDDDVVAGRIVDSLINILCKLELLLEFFLICQSYHGEYGKIL